MEAVLMLMMIEAEKMLMEVALMLIEAVTLLIEHFLCC